MGEYEQYLSQFNLDDARKMSEEAPRPCLEKWTLWHPLGLMSAFHSCTTWLYPHHMTTAERPSHNYQETVSLYSLALKMIHIKLLKLRSKAQGENRTIPTIKTELQH